MSTPAEIIAARVNGTYVPEVQEVTPKKEKSKPVSKENAFPVLGGRQSSPAAAGVSNANTAWGPGAKENGKTASAPLTPGSSRGSPSPAAKTAFKGSHIQEAFSLDAEDQLNVNKAEFIKILTNIKSETKAGIECTISQHTKKRTFLITGTPGAVRLAKRLVIKKLTKPVLLVFSIPARLRSKVIGPQGRTLKPIIAENEVKIDIGNTESSPAEGDEDEDDIFATTVQVTIEGDAEGSKRAKAAILDIVKTETRELSVRVPVTDFLKPFVGKAIAPLQSKYSYLEFDVPVWKSALTSIIISGDRETVLEARDELKDLLASLKETLSVQIVNVPKVKHQFLPVERILEEDNVLIQFLDDDDDSVKFVGERSKFPQAQEKARQTTLQYKVEVLDMSKAHKGNLPHVRAVASYLTKTGKFKEIAEAHGIAVNPPKEKFLLDETKTSLPIEIVVRGDDVENTKQARKAIVGVVNKIIPEKTKVFESIDPFLLPRVPAILDPLVEEKKVEYVILGDRVVLFDVSNTEESEDFDFEDSTVNGLAEAEKSLQELKALEETLDSRAMNFESEAQTKIFGINETTMKLLLNEIGPDTVEVRACYDGKERNERFLYIHGFKPSVEKMEAAIQQVWEDVAENKRDYAEYPEIPVSILPRFIGKNGANINAIRKQFGVRIEVNDLTEEAKSKDKNAKTNLAVDGNKLNVKAAVAHINLLSKKMADESIVRVKVDQEYHRRIAGPGFAYVKRLEDKYKVAIKFPSADSESDSDSTNNEIVIRGPTKGVAKAEEEIRELYAYEKENGHKQTLEIPVKAIARVIGKNGETIKDIADGCGIDYRFKRDKSEEEATGFAEVELIGSKSALKEAVAKIKELIDEIENYASVTIHVPRQYHRALVGQGGARLREIISNAGGDSVPRQKYNRLLNVPNEGSESDEVQSSGEKQIVDKIVAQVEEFVKSLEASIEEVYDLAKEKHKLIVGPQGSIRQLLEKEYDVFINIPRPQDNLTEIKLKGLPENIEKAKAKIDDLTKDNWTHSIDVPGHLHALVTEKGGIFKTLKADYNVEISHGNMTRKASKLSGRSIPAPPEEALANDEEKTKFTTALLEGDEADVVIPWRFIGDEEATAKATKFVEELLEKAKNATHQGWFYCRKNTTMFPRLVGPQGRNLKKIREETGTFITVPRENHPFPNYVYVVGSEEGMKKAEEALSKRV